MYELVKHTAKKSTVLFTSPCEIIARARFYKSAALLKINETLELRHDGQVVYSIKACGYSVGSKADEDGVAIFPEASGTLKDTCNVSGLLPAQFRSSPVDCGIGWKEHAKQEPRKAKAESVALEMEEQIEERLSIRTEIQAFIQASLDKPPVLFGIDPAAETKPILTDLTSVKVGDFVAIHTTNTERMKAYSQWGIKLGKYYEVLTVSTDNTAMRLQVLNCNGVPIWVEDEDVRLLTFDLSDN